VKILGSSAAVPHFGRNHSAQILKIHNKTFLIDCGEGTQIQLKKRKIKVNRIHAIFISHLHGDHFLGLFGLLSTMNIYGRKHDLDLFGPKGLLEFIELQIQITETHFNYTINFTELNKDTSECLLETDKLEVLTIPLEHQIYCNGFLFREKSSLRKINFPKLPIFINDRQQFEDLRLGKDLFDPKGNLIVKNKEVTELAPRGRSYAYCSDTRYNEKIIDLIKGASLLYHESTFLSELEDRAFHTFHSTAQQAAHIAKKAQVNQLLLGHFSARYAEVEPFVEEAKEVFINSHLALEGTHWLVSNA
jgi:ribonuclease Z